MIYSDEIGISVLGSPLTFTLPKDYRFYPEQLEYTPVLLSNHYLQILVSETIFESPPSLVLKMKRCDGVLIRESTFTVRELSANNYFADINLIIGSYVGKAYFEIHYNGDLLARSIIYEINPTYTSLHKTIRYHHRKNDFNVVFNQYNTKNWFSLAVECGFKGNSLEISDEAEDYKQQDMTNTRVFSRPFLTETLTIGSGRGIPSYLYEKLSLIFACSDIVINRVAYRVAGEAKLEKEKDDEGGFGVYSIKLQRINNYLETDFYSGKVFTDEFNNQFS